jgi:hypothetical protein
LPVNLVIAVQCAACFWLERMEKPNYSVNISSFPPWLMHFDLQ